METTLTKRGQISVPAKIIKSYHLKPGSKFYWLDTGMGIKLIPLPDNIIEYLHKSAKDENMLEELLKERKKDKNLENKKFEK